jgi:hypothetical protein
MHRHIRVEPKRHNVLYVGCERAGVFNSTDRGETWFPINSGLDDLSVFGLAIDPSMTYAPLGSFICFESQGFSPYSFGCLYTVAAYDTGRSKTLRESEAQADSITRSNKTEICMRSKSLKELTPLVPRPIVRALFWGNLIVAACVSS